MDLEMGQWLLGPNSFLVSGIQISTRSPTTYLSKVEVWNHVLLFDYIFVLFFPILLQSNLNPKK